MHFGNLSVSAACGRLVQPAFELLLLVDRHLLLPPVGCLKSPGVPGLIPSEAPLSRVRHPSDRRSSITHVRTRDPEEVEVGAPTPIFPGKVGSVLHGRPMVGA